MTSARCAGLQDMDTTTALADPAGHVGEVAGPTR